MTRPEEHHSVSSSPSSGKHPLGWAKMGSGPLPPPPAAAAAASAPASGFPSSAATSAAPDPVSAAPGPVDAPASAAPDPVASHVAAPSTDAAAAAVGSGHGSPVAGIHTRPEQNRFSTGKQMKTNDILSSWESGADRTKGRDNRLQKKRPKMLLRVPTQLSST